MKTKQWMTLPIAALVFGFGTVMLTGCEDGEVEDAADDAGDAIKDGAEDLKDSVDEGLEEIKDEVDDATTD